MPRTDDPAAAEVFRHLFASVPEEMGITLERTAYSPNIKERRDHSCALFDSKGLLVAQAAHIPVHLGAFPLLMERLASAFPWRPGDVVICNDPYMGGTHLPDITLVSPAFSPSGRLAGFVANRAHHADVGGAWPGSMGPGTELFQEGIVIPPCKLYDGGRLNGPLLDLILRNVRTPMERRGDLDAQLAANATGLRRFGHLLAEYGSAEVRTQVRRARAASRRGMLRLLGGFPAGRHSFTDYLDDDGQGSGPLPIQAALWVEDRALVVDFDGTAPQQKGCVNATLAVTHSAVYYVATCLLGHEQVFNAGAASAIRVNAPPGSLVHARPPAAVAAGNVETSQRIVDTLFGALAKALPDRVPAASQGTMNNLTLGGIDPSGQPWAYYETVGGGAGASAEGPGVPAVHCHMSNTRNTPVEALEYHYPLRVRRYGLRDDSGGSGRHSGGCGVVREIELLAPATASLLTDRRQRGPYGLAGGADGSPGRNHLLRDGKAIQLAGKTSVELQAADTLRVETPGGGGWGANPEP